MSLELKKKKFLNNSMLKLMIDSHSYHIGCQIWKMYPWAPPLRYLTRWEKNKIIQIIFIGSSSGFIQIGIENIFFH